jgi:hypothetical protein
MSPEEKAKELGIDFPEIPKLYLNLCIRTGNLLMTSGHVSNIKGKLGKDLSVEEGYAAAKECAIKILQSVHHTHGTLDGLRRRRRFSRTQCAGICIATNRSGRRDRSDIRDQRRIAHRRLLSLGMAGFWRLAMSRVVALTRSTFIAVT